MGCEPLYPRKCDMMRDFALVLSVIALCAVLLTAGALYKHTTDSTIHCSPNKCPGCPDGKCPVIPDKPYKPRRTGEVIGEPQQSSNTDGIKVRDQ